MMFLLFFVLFQVEVLLPGVDSIPDFVQDASPHLDDYYLVKSIPVSELVKEEFVNQILRKGQTLSTVIGNLQYIMCQWNVY